LGLDHALAQDGIEVLRSPVGDRAVALKIREAGGTFGGESSGHLIFSEYLPTGDGLLCALQVLALLQRHPGKGFAELAEGIRMFPQATAKVEVSAKPPLENLAGLLAARRATEQELGASGRILVRYSGTEPILRILVEAETNQAADRACEHLRQAASLDLGAGV
jgi:phosphoglucosamine mutase